MLRVAMLSFWHVHAGDYARQATEHPDVEIIGAWDDDPERGRAGAEKLGVKYYDDLAELLGSPDLDGVIVDTPTNLHPEVIGAAIRAGKHVFTEKVLALSTADADALIAAARDAGVALVLSLPRLYHGYTQAVADVLASGRLGEITLVRTRLAHNGAVGKAWLPDRFFDPEACGGGAMVDLGCHPMYLARLFAGGMPESLTASYGSVTGRAVEDNAVAVLRYPDGKLAVVEAGFAAAQSPFTIEIYGTAGSLLFDTSASTLKVRAGDDSGWSELPIPDDQPTAFVQWVRHAADGSWASHNVDVGADLTRLMEAANASAASGASVRLDGS